MLTPTQVCTRFAPSPTGFLHLGGVRTAFYSLLYAKKHQGKFILRIEDTDRERSTEEAVQVILDGMLWLNLHYDEGPFYQTQRFARYETMIAQLLAEGKAYRCYCSIERLDALRATQLKNKQKPRYDGRCREHASQDDLKQKNMACSSSSYVIRFKNPLEGSVVVHDAIHGTLNFANTELDDLIIARSDGTPTYNFTVVVDDWDMGVTHVIRGDDHINNTPRQINLLNALGGVIPIYAHVPMILGHDGKRLSKRHGAISVLQYREEGILPEALLNYLVRLGWSHGDQEIFSMDELVQYFDIYAVNRSAAAFNQEKLLWFNQHYLKTSDLEYLAKELTWHLKRLNVSLEAIKEGPALIDVIKAQRERVKTLREMAEKSLYFYQDANYIADWESYFKEAFVPILFDLYAAFEMQSLWNAETIHQVLSQYVEKTQLPFGQFAQPLRVAVTGGTHSPPIDITMALVGKSRSLARLHHRLMLIAT